MTYIIPNQSTKQHSQTNKGDTTGTIYKSRNINLDETGYIKLADATYAQYTEDDNANFDVADAMYAMDNEIYINSDYVFRGTLGLATLNDSSGDTNTPSPNVEEDVIYFNGTKVVTDGTSLKYISAPTVWTTVSLIGSGFSTSNPTCMTVWDTKSSLCVGNSNVVKFINTSWAVNATVLTLPNEYNVSSMASSGTQLFIGTRSKSGSDAKLFVINNIQVGVDSAYSAGTFEIFSVKRFKDTVCVIDTMGRLSAFNGGGLRELATLPIYIEDMEWADSQNDYSKVANRAMVTDGDLIYVNLSSETEEGRLKVLPNFPSGIWCYDDTNESLYHRYSPSYSRIEKIDGNNVTVSTSNNNFTLTSGNLNNFVTGMPVMYDSITTTIPELRSATGYFLIKDSSTVFRLATSYANAIAGTPIDISDVGTVSQDFYVYKINDYGWSYYATRMSVAVLNNLLYDQDFSGRLAYTAELGSKQAISTFRTVFGGTNPFIPNRGYFVTPRLNSSNIEEVYNQMYLKFKPLGADDKILIKIKTRDKYGIPFASVQNNVSYTNFVGTWTDTDTFTTTVDMSLASVGDEIEIIAGVGAGHLAHISSISLSSGTYTVNLGEAFPFAVAGDQMYFQVDNFALLETITSSTKTAERCFASLPIGTNNASQFVQLKIELRGISTTVSELQVFHKKFIGEIAVV